MYLDFSPFFPHWLFPNSQCCLDFLAVVDDTELHELFGKEAKDLYSENYKMLMKEIEDDTDGKIDQLIRLEGSILLK